MNKQVSNKIKEILSVGEWREIEGYSNYTVNTDGDILNKTNGELVKQHFNTGGYRVVSLSVNGKRRMELVHRLVAKAFIPNPDQKPIVNHLDSNRANPKKENLEWVTHKENSEHMVNSFRSPNQMTTILLDKNGREIRAFPSTNRCIDYIFKRFRIEHGYDEGEPIVEDIEFYKELPPVLRDGLPAKCMKLNF